MAQVKIALAALAAACGGDAQAKKGFDAVGARVRIAAANRSAVAAERAEKARFARMQKEYPFCNPAAAELYMSEDGRNICGLSDEEPVAEYRLVQFPHSEWNALADLCWKALRSGCLCVLGLESAPQILESALDQERDLGNVAESVKGAICGKLRHAREVLTDPAVRAWLPYGSFKNVDLAYVDDFAEVYEKALRSLTCQDVTRDDVDALLQGNAALTGILDPDAVGDDLADELVEATERMRDELRRNGEAVRHGYAWADGLWAKPLSPDAPLRDVEKKQLEQLTLDVPLGAVRVIVHGSDESCWARYWDVAPEFAEECVRNLAARIGVKDGHEYIRVVCMQTGADHTDPASFIIRALNPEWVLSAGAFVLGNGDIRFAEAANTKLELLYTIDALEDIGWLEYSLNGMARIRAARRQPGKKTEEFFDSAKQVVDKRTLEVKSLR
ncbi:hypothetical protein [Paratractidigestivibacter sp.]|uniref:hypothetical protein n=1 Tax=Paratractidigestivibacter sp. TaxID=2847316 RepID=UPI002ACB1205|nr:hypothetical protein [Paratractidigestivibacter sp.]